MYLHCLNLQPRNLNRHPNPAPISLFMHNPLHTRTSTTMPRQIQGGGGPRAGRRRCRPPERRSGDQRDGPHDHHEWREGPWRCWALCVRLGVRLSWRDAPQPRRGVPVTRARGHIGRPRTSVPPHLHAAPHLRTARWEPADGTSWRPWAGGGGAGRGNGAYVWHPTPKQGWSVLTRIHTRCQHQSIDA
jgi:hypothetical protein